MMFFSSNPRNPDFAKDPAVVRFKGKYFLYYSIASFPQRYPEDWSIAVAQSSDLIHWTYVKELEIRSENPQCSRGAAPAARVIDDKVYLFYQAPCDELRGRVPVPDAIYLAESLDGLNFETVSGNPVFHPPVSAYSCGRAIDADLIFFKGKYFLYAATRDPEFRIQKIVAGVSAGGFPGNPFFTALNGVVLEPELEWEQQCVEAPAALVHDDRIYLFYGGAYNNAPQQIGCAVSSDGIHFERLFKEPFLPCGTAGTWNSSESGHPFAFTDDDGCQYLFFQGNNDHGKTWYLSVKKILWDGAFPILQDLP